VKERTVMDDIPKRKLHVCFSYMLMAPLLQVGQVKSGLRN
jgi:hypothetical protein